ncbi:MAG: hypothetical protein K2W96_03375 [Gemmataceae bacterium]|nr:hypothetical protein [Gemmataceae bacterium]
MTLKCSHHFPGGDLPKIDRLSVRKRGQLAITGDGGEAGVIAFAILERADHPAGCQIPCLDGAIALGSCWSCQEEPPIRRKDKHVAAATDLMEQHS